MWVAQEAVPEPDDDAQPPPAGETLRRRRGATSMEYVVMASFILMVLIGAVQYFGYSVGNLYTADAAATSKATVPPPPSN